MPYSAMVYETLRIVISSTKSKSNCIFFRTPIVCFDNDIELNTYKLIAW